MQRPKHKAPWVDKVGGEGEAERGDAGDQQWAGGELMVPDAPVASVQERLRAF